ncbi:MAG: hypothetical protein CM15mP84_00470 [Cellvibrionales bacterium]|nr:MAG: hypothetical protein CM15mP84_00470 [Cellvibrionales bacterium]
MSRSICTLNGAIVALTLLICAPSKRAPWA